MDVLITTQLERKARILLADYYVRSCHENLSIYIAIVSDIHTNSLNVQSLSFLDLVLQITHMIGSSIACHGDDSEFPPSNID